MDAHPNPLSFSFPFRAFTGSRPTFIIWDGWRGGLAPEGLVCGGRDQRGAAVPARTARGCGGRATRMGVRRWALTGRMPGEA
jgi:hypothetical protein